MKKISKEADLSTIYSNHTISYNVTILDKSGYEARHIMSISGYRSESSIRSYSKTDEAIKKRILETLTSHVSSSFIEDRHPESTPLNLFPLLTTSQEERILAILDIQHSNELES